MSGVYNRGMQMPENCRECRVDGRDCKEWKWFDKWRAQRAPDCPLVSVPDHGRLIDADALEEYLVNDPYCLTIFDAINKLQGMPAIIPADKEET